MGYSSKEDTERKKVPADQSVQLSTLESLLENNLEFASKPFKIKKSTSTLSEKELLASLNRFKMIVSLVRDSTYWILKIIEVRNYSDAELKRVFDLLKAMLVVYFDNKKSPIKSGFLKEIFRRHPRIFHRLLGSLQKKCGCAKSDFYVSRHLIW